ncbi:KilA-N domain-containing protein, partial [Candidatus Margulisiibacteriota bacterium]
MGIIYADEAELLNIALFNMTSKEWRLANQDITKKGENIRDYASVAQLTILANLESYNSILIRKSINAEKRLQELRNLAITQLKTFRHSQYQL